MNTATQTGIDAARTTSKRVAQKTEETTGDLIGNKIADKITSVGKSKNRENKYETNQIEKNCIPSEKRQKIIDA